MSSEAVMAKDIVELSKSRGYLAKQLYAIFTTPTNGMGPVMENLKAHLAYQESLDQRGIMFAAGPHWSDDAQRWDGEGLVVIRAASIAEAQQLAAEEPMHKAGARKYRVRPWLVNEGGITLKVSFATGRFELV